MSELMLINPRERKRSRRRSTETKAARSRAAKRGWARRRRNPESRSERSAAAKRGWSGRRRSNPSVRASARRVYHRAKPRMAEIGETIMHGAVGAGGGIALDVIMAKVPLPAALKVGVGHTATKAAGAVLLGMLGSRFLSTPMANSLAIGSMATVLHDAAREFLAPHIAMADLGYYNAGWPVGDETPLALQDLGDGGGMAEYVGDASEEGVSEYVQDLGY